MKMRLLGDKAAWKWGYLELRPLDNTQPRNNEGGSSLGSRAPKGRVPLIRPRRDRIMGSSILASLSEAGGNDPFLPISGPLPPHGPVGADRVGTRPTHGHMQLGGPNCAWTVTSQVPIFNDLTRSLEKCDWH